MKGERHYEVPWEQAKGLEMIRGSPVSERKVKWDSDTCSDSEDYWTQKKKRKMQHKVILRFGSETPDYILRMVHHCFQPRNLKSIDLRDKELPNILHGILRGSPLRFTSWGMLFKYLRYCTSIATTLYVIREDSLAILFDDIVFRIIQLLARPTTSVPPAIVHSFARLLLFLRAEGNLNNVFRQDILKLMDRERLLERLVVGIKKDKDNVYLMHYLGVLFHYDNTLYHLREMTKLESFLPPDLILYAKLTILDSWSFMFIQHGPESMSSIGVTPSVFHNHLLHLKKHFEIHQEVISQISEPWVDWYKGFFLCKFAICYSYIICRPIDALNCIASFLDLKCESLPKHLVLQLPVLMHISSFYGSPSLYEELKGELEKYPYVREAYYLRATQTFPPPLRITLYKDKRPEVPIEASKDDGFLTLEPTQCFESPLDIQQTFDLSSYDSYSYPLGPLECLSTDAESEESSSPGGSPGLLDGSQDDQVLLRMVQYQVRIADITGQLNNSNESQDVSQLKNTLEENVQSLQFLYESLKKL